MAAMADVTGPISTLPGALHRLPIGAKCDDHPDRQAVARVQGETDSFGSELMDLCQECLDAMKNADAGGICDWCGADAASLKPTRDYEEGSRGRVYEVCSECISRMNSRLEQEAGYYD